MIEERNNEYLLGVDDFGRYEIIEHRLNHSPYQGGVTCAFVVDDLGMSDGDGHPTRYEKTAYERIPESVFQKVMVIFRETGNKMCSLAEDVKELDREIREGDYLYLGGYFFFIESLSNLTSKSWIKTFYYNGYDLSIDTDTETYSNLDEWMDEMYVEFINEFKLINKEIYEKALNIAKSGVLEVKDYLKNILFGK